MSSIPPSGMTFCLVLVGLLMSVVLPRSASQRFGHLVIQIEKAVLQLTTVGFVVQAVLHAL